MAKRPVLITRPTEDARELASTAARAGAQPVLEPLLTIGYLDEKLELDGLQGLIFTSANGVRAFTRLTKRRDHSVYAVGPASAREAREAGFKKVHVAAGDVEALADMIRDKCVPNQGAFLHAAGSALAGDLAGELGRSGFEIRRAVLYSAGKADRLSQNALDAIKSPQGCIIPLFSPRTAETLLALVTEAGVSSQLAGCTALCLSQAVADKLTPSQWATVIVVDRPDSDLLLAKLDKILNGEDRDRDMTDDKKNNTDDQAPDRAKEKSTDNDRAGSDHTGNDEALNLDAEALIEAFGGIRPMANKLDVAVSTVQGWKQRNHIPENRLDDIQRAAAENGIDLIAIATMSVAANPAPEAQEATAPSKDEAHPANESATDTSNTASGNTTIQAQNMPANEITVIKRGGSRVAWLALLLSAGMGAALVTQPYWGETVRNSLHPSLSKFAPNLFAKPGSNQADQEIASLKSSLGEVNERLLSLESRPVGTDPSAAITDLEAVEKRIRDLELQVVALDTVSRTSVTAKSDQADTSALETRLDRMAEMLQARRSAGLESQNALRQAVTSQGEQTAAVAARLEALSSRLQAAETQLSSLKSAPGSRDQREVALVIAVGQMESELVAGQPYYRSLTSLQALARNLPDLNTPLAKLAPYAEGGLPTRTELNRRFEQMMTELRDPVQEASLENWLDASLANIKNLVHIRPTGAAADLPPESLAENALRQDDLPGAVAALSPLESTTPLIADWLKAANSRIEAESALSELRRIAVHNLALAAAPKTAEELAREIIQEGAPTAPTPVSAEPAGDTE
ncbi:uroporphyrinogen-III synthase [Aestuariispira insulae]|uniref:uroporphyrinogen-III synthase n=1 Tax=Aestuariispira insulae TaxID=1461337 RepID=UPI0015F286C3|nr:uroporphyrinogen-III synthase [Aestuariispira insulae]